MPLIWVTPGRINYYLLRFVVLIRTGIETTWRKTFYGESWLIILVMMFTLSWTLQTSMTRCGDQLEILYWDRSLYFHKIIERARQNHLLDVLRSQTTCLSDSLLDQVLQSWKSFVRIRVSKGVPETEKAGNGNEEAAWSRISLLYSTPGWKQECLKRDEKFDMHYSSAVSNKSILATSLIEPLLYS